MKRVITYGTFDLLHIGHINILRRARELGDELTVVLSSDEFNKVKGKTSVNSYDDRKIILESIIFVDKVIPETHWDQKINDVIENEIHIFVMGNDWEGKFDYLSEYCEVIYLTRTEDISTTMIKDILKHSK